VSTNKAEFAIDRRWQLDERVAVRPEPFGALLYDFRTRRLSFLKSRKLHEVVRALGDHPSARSAFEAAGVTDDEMDSYVRALSALAEAEMITAC
jgi:putative mycofactocin binding protein MftB